MAAAAATSVTPSSDGSVLEVKWQHPSVPRSTFDAAFLRNFADQVAQPIHEHQQQIKPAGDWFDFLHMNKGRSREEQTLWRNDGKFAGPPQFDYEALADPAVHEEYLKALMNPGCAIVNNMPKDPAYDGSVLTSFAEDYLGCLQKHPLRESSHWTISTDAAVFDPSNKLADKRHGENGVANSYNTDVQLGNHTDQSLYTLPGLLLGFHCAMGEGNNSLTDGFAVAYAMQDRHPEQYATLCELGMNAGRKLTYYRAAEMDFSGQHKVLTEDEHGNMVRVQYHEIYRSPSTHSYEDFPRFSDAISTFYQLVHSPEFQIHLTLHEDQFLLMNNWRTMHGRAGLKGKARTIIGGTVTRDGFVSAVRQLRRKQYAVSDENLDVGLPLGQYPHLGALNEQLQATKREAEATIAPANVKVEIPAPLKRAA